MFCRGGFHTIMAYSRSGEKRINFYSTPLKKHFSPKVSFFLFLPGYIFLIFKPPLVPPDSEQPTNWDIVQ